LRIFAVSDLHMPGDQNKSMDIFGDEWHHHVRKIFAAWQEEVEHSDIVLVPGDISWAMDLKDALADLNRIREQPGTIVISKGNHDYWWASISKVRQSLPPDMFALQNDHYALPCGRAICATRGWLLPGSSQFDEETDRKVYKREIGRLENSLVSAVKAGLRPYIAMLHYPPTNENGTSTGFTDLLDSYSVPICIYGHLHGDDHKLAFQGRRAGTNYRLVACDAIDFRPIQVASILETC